MRRMKEGKVELVGHLHSLVREHPEFEVLCEPTSYLYYFRYLPNALAERQHESEVQKQLNTLNEEIVRAVKRDAPVPLMMMRSDGRFAIRISICSQRTSQADVDATFEAIARWGRLLTRKLSVSHELTPDVEEKLCSSESHSLSTGV
jgi:glutamate/tyrosine decarboxylase-like PLP-dependent enzyme